VLELRDLTVRFGGVTPLEDVSLSCASGVWGLIGPNGAGKTTLLNVLSGMVKPVRGAVTFEGFDLLSMGASARARWGLARTFQQDQVVDELTVGHNVAVAAEHGGRGGDGLSAEDALALVGLSERSAEPAIQLSAGERRRLDIARALATRPRIVLLDEPGAGLLPSETAELVGLIEGMRRRTSAMIVLIDHDMSLVRAACEVVAVLDFGRLVAMGPTGQVLADPRVGAAYLGTEDVE
jgi:branched-chain amino acid transport system ATP-binding protein